MARKVPVCVESDVLVGGLRIKCDPLEPSFPSDQGLMDLAVAKRAIG